MSALCAAWLSYARLSTWCSAIARRMLRDRWTLPFSVCAVGPGRAIPCFLRLNNNNISYEKIGIVYDGSYAVVYYC